MKISLTIATIIVLVLSTTSTIQISSASLAHVQTTPTYQRGPIAKPPHVVLDPGFNPATVFNPATLVGGAPFCRSGLVGTYICYPPAFLKKAYDFPAALTGAGQTIVIVDAFGSPTLQSDLNTFDTAFGLPATTVTILCGPTWTGASTDHCPTFNPADGNQVGWAEETTLDVTMAHGLATGAKIVLVVADTNMDPDLNAAEMAVVTQPALRGSIMSQSFGEPDDSVGCLYTAQCNHLNMTAYDPTIKATADSIYSIANANSWTVLASSGDDGANENTRYFGTTELTASWPASNPLNLAIGGTQGFHYGGQYGGLPGPGYYFTCAPGATCSTGLVMVNGGASGCTAATRPAVPTGCSTTGYGGEGAWNEFYAWWNDTTGWPGDPYGPWFGASTSTGGGVSTLYAKPDYQAGLPSSFQVLNGTSIPSTGRLNPDVSFNAAINGGVLAYFGLLSGWLLFGGTSASTPAWAAIIALLNQANGKPVGFINPAIYALANSNLYSHAFHDITVGNNTNILPPSADVQGFPALTGYDLTTGWGTPDVANFINDIQYFLSATPYYTINLVQGWNLISLPLVLQNNPITKVLAALIKANEVTVVWAYQGGVWKSLTPPSTGTLVTMQDGVGYWIYMKQPDTLFLTNSYVILPGATPPSYALPIGWNLIGFKPEPTVANETVGVYLTSTTGKYDTSNVWIYDNVSGYWTRAAGGQNIQPGQGLWIYMTSAATLYP